MITKTYGKEFFGQPAKLLEQMKKDGFAFVSEICPIKLKEPKEIHPNDDGSTTFTQWTQEEWDDMESNFIVI